MPDEAVTVDYLMDNVWIVGDAPNAPTKNPELTRRGRLRRAPLDHDPNSDDAGWDHESLRLLMETWRPGPRLG